MEKTFVYLKLFQIMLTLTIIWQLISLRQFCGTFIDPKTFLCDLSSDDCERFWLIGMDSKTGEFGSMYKKLHNQFLMNSSANAPQYQYFYFLVAKLPPAGRHCIPITITPFDGFFEWIGILNRNPLSNGTLLHFSRLFLFALLSLGFLCYAIMEMLHSMEEYEFSAYPRAFAFAFCWCCTGVDSFKLLVYWTDFWSCVNFRADHTNVPLVTLVISIVLVCSSILEIVLHKFVLNDVDMESANVMMISDQQQQKKQNGSACAIE